MLILTIIVCVILTMIITTIGIEERSKFEAILIVNVAIIGVCFMVSLVISMFTFIVTSYEVKEKEPVKIVKVEDYNIIIDENDNIFELNNYKLTDQKSYSIKTYRKSNNFFVFDFMKKNNIDTQYYINKKEF